MALSGERAHRLANMLPPRELFAFRFICGKNESRKWVTEDTINNLVALELVRRDRDGERDLVLLTPRGKKVAEFV